MKDALARQKEQRRTELYNQGLSDEEMAMRLGVVRETIRDWRRARSLPPNKIEKRNYEKDPCRALDKDLVNWARRCGTCRIKEPSSYDGEKIIAWRCRRLIEMIGQKKECPFWSDEPEIMEQIERRLKRHGNRK